jgi:hypothetical protein
MRNLMSLGLVAGMLGLVGCATTPQTTQTKATTPDARPSVSTDTDQAPPPQPSVDEPTPEELASSPCGNPNWAQLPPDSEVDGDTKDQKDEDSETDEKREGEE